VKQTVFASSRIALEWFNPDYQKYGKPSFPGGLSVNPYTGKCCDPFVGYKPVKDFLQDSKRLSIFLNINLYFCSSKTADGITIL
jgi:hypothetical protein